MSKSGVFQTVKSSRNASSLPIWKPLLTVLQKVQKRRVLPLLSELSDSGGQGRGLGAEK